VQNNALLKYGQVTASETCIMRCFLSSFFFLSGYLWSSLSFPYYLIFLKMEVVFFYAVSSIQRSSLPKATEDYRNPGQLKYTSANTHTHTHTCVNLFDQQTSISKAHEKESSGGLETEFMWQRAADLRQAHTMRESHRQRSRFKNGQPLTNSNLVRGLAHLFDQQTSISKAYRKSSGGLETELALQHDFLVYLFLLLF
jgi:hypothetical protein